MIAFFYFIINDFFFFLQFFTRFYKITRIGYERFFMRFDKLL